MTKPTNAGQFINKAVSQADAFAAFNNVVEAGREYLTLREVESTKRAKIAAKQTLETERIRAAERVLSEYFDRVFTERATNFSEMWTRLDEAAESGDDQTVRHLLGSIVQLAQSSPLAALADDLPALRAAFDDPDHSWDF